ncbi:hypothetical protein A628_05251 [Salmonella enterica subsp. enterica serovar Cubana str. 76814]|uniref:Uncharacterized protein n=1 Tax=Salmonella enterica subsp. enterica serovar Cubana str. 76814 TaxID=1192560 RepID=V7IHD7_SALET|nr:hypothetical protein A628_05251 [Salmonella enterica subsp. enterica serovar Cubana str. 76814]
MPKLVTETVQKVFPAPAGINRNGCRGSRRCGRVPRASGDKPVCRD